LAGNIGRARKAAAALYRKGWAPFIPHTMTAHFDSYFPDIKKETYLETDLEWLRQCDAILLLDGWGTSEGAKAEYEEAAKWGKTIYHSIENVPDLTDAKPIQKDEARVAQNPINHPPHYTQGKMECITAIEGLGLPFHEAQVLKYLVRWRYKGGVEDLKKAEWFLERLIEHADELVYMNRPIWWTNEVKGGERDA